MNRTSSRGRLLSTLAAATRGAALLAFVATLAVPIISTQQIALATHTQVTHTPAVPPSADNGIPPWAYPEPYPHGHHGQATPTSTPTQVVPRQPYPTYQGQPYPGGPNQPLPGGTVPQPGRSMQESVSSPPYPGAPGTDFSTAPGGLPGGAIVSSGASPVPGGTDPCYGDEVISYSPQAPRIGNELLIAVTSSRPHPYGRLAGTEATRFVRERPGQKGYVWEWTVEPSYPGEHRYVYYVDSTVPCQTVTLRVQESLATRTQTPTKQPTPYGFNSNDNSRGNSNDNSANNSSHDPYNTGASYAPPVDPSRYVTAGQDVRNCADFQSQSNAQRVLRYDPNDPNQLDAEDGMTDGVACSSFNYSQYPNDRDFGVVSRTMSTPTPGTFDPKSYIGQGDRFGCLDFASHAQAQAVLRADPNDPNRLDANPRDGLACGGVEAAADGVAGGFMHQPSDANRVTRP